MVGSVMAPSAATASWRAFPTRALAGVHASRLRPEGTDAIEPRGVSVTGATSFASHEREGGGGEDAEAVAR